MALTEKDLKNIEMGYANVAYTEGFGLKRSSTLLSSASHYIINTAFYINRPYWNGLNSGKIRGK